MKASRQSSRIRPALLLALGLGLSGFSAGLVKAQGVPGEDPVILTKRVSTVQLPDSNRPKSTPLDNPEMPASLRAKVARFEAKANSDSTSGFSTDKDATRETSSDGFKKTCIQEVGSTSSPSGPNPANSPAGNQQIVVLKGDLVNICK
jgi:hypothetical protein